MPTWHQATSDGDIWPASLQGHLRVCSSDKALSSSAAKVGFGLGLEAFKTAWQLWLAQPGFIQLGQGLALNGFVCFGSYSMHFYLEVNSLLICF